MEKKKISVIKTCLFQFLSCFSPAREYFASREYFARQRVFRQPESIGVFAPEGGLPPGKAIVLIKIHKFSCLYLVIVL